MSMHNRRIHRKRQILRPPLDNDEPDRDGRGREEEEEEEPVRTRRPRPPTTTETETESERSVTSQSRRRSSTISATPSRIISSPSASASSASILSSASASPSPSVSITPSPAITQPTAPTRPVQTPTMSSPSNSASQAAASDPSTIGAASSTNAGPIVGGVMGAIAGIAVLYFTVMFAVRRHRKRKLEEDAFSAPQFRKSAVMLNDGPDYTTPFMAQQPSSPFPASASRYHAPSAVSHPGSAFGSSTTYSPPSIQYGMPQDTGYHYQGQPVVPEHLHRHQQPAGYDHAPMQPMQATALVGHAPQGHYVDATRVPTTVPPSVPEKALPPAPVASAAPAGNEVDPSGLGKPRRQTVYDPDDVYGGIA